MKRATASRSVGRGLARVEPDAGTLVVYAAKNGQIAFDGDRQQGADTRAALVKSASAKGQRLYSEHFPFPGIGKIVMGKDGATWQPESL